VANRSPLVLAAGQPQQLQSGDNLDLVGAQFVNAPLAMLFTQGRLTAQTATPIPSSDQTAVTSVYWTPFGGCLLGLPLTTTNWVLQSFAEQQLRLTDAQSTNATYNNGSATLSNLTSTAQLVRGMKISSSKSGIGALTISSIDSATQVTMSGNASVSQTGATITFKCPASTLYDVFGVPLTATTMRIQLGTAWTNTTTRAAAVTQGGALNGVLVNDAAIGGSDSNAIAAQGGRFLGTIALSTTDGQTTDSEAARFVWNQYNRVARSLHKEEMSGDHVYSSITVRYWNNDTTQKLEFVQGGTGTVKSTVAATMRSSTTVGVPIVGLSGDSVAIGTAYLNTVSTSGQRSSAAAVETYAAGYHYIGIFEQDQNNGASSVTSTMAYMRCYGEVFA
jgi:hypothetical protein